MCNQMIIEKKILNEIASENILMILSRNNSKKKKKCIYLPNLFLTSGIRHKVIFEAV